MSVPGAPNIWARPLGTLNQLEFWWQPPQSGGGSITYYQLTCPAILLVQNYSSNVFQTRISSLSNVQEYQFTLAAANSFGLGPPSAFVSVQPGDKPKSNFIQSVTMISPSTLSVVWNFAQNQNEGTTKWFVASAIPSTPSLSTLQFTAVSTATSTLMTYLSTDTYALQAFAVNDSGWQYADKTEIQYVDTKMYNIQPVAAKNVIITSLSTTSASIKWVPGSYQTYYKFFINNVISQPTTYSYISSTATFTSLKPATSYILTINSFNNIGTTASNPIVITTDTMLPTSITSVIMTYRTASGLDIQWTGGFGAASWSFSLNAITVQPFLVDLVQNVVKFRNLDPNVIYAVVITATNIGGSISSESKNFITLPLAPSDPANLLLPYIDYKGFSLSFISGNSPDNVVSNYLFYVNQEVNIPSTFWYSSYTSGTSILVSTLSSYTIQTLQNIRTPSTFVYPSPSSMWFSTFISTNGSSFWYSTFSTLSTVNSTYSSIISLFASTTNISTFSTLSSVVIGSTISTYIVKTGDEKVVQFNNLSSGTAYQLIIQASNIGGTVSSLSSWVSTLAALPIIPVITSGTSVGPYDITVTWTGGTYATRYVFYLNGIETTAESYNLTNKTAKFIGLNYSTLYAVVVTAVNVSAATSSAQYNVTTPIAPPSQPTQLVTTAVTSDGFTVSWSEGLLSSSYGFLINGLLATPASYSTTNKTVTFTGLLPSTSYNLVVIATNASGTNESNPQSITTLIAIPTTPTNIQTTTLDYSYFSLSWTGGDIASSFSFTLNGTTTLPTAYSLSLKTATFSNLSPSTAYAVIITATNSTGSTASNSYTVTTTIQPPDYPTSVTNSSKTYNTINLYWAGAARASDYSFTVNGAAVVPSTYSVANKTATFTGLIAYNDYTFVVTAINVSGSTSSAPVTIKTRLAPPSQPQSLASNSITQSSFTVTWAMPNQIPLQPTSNLATDFFFTLNGLSVTPSSYSVSGFSVSFTGLIAGTTYAVIVTSFNESGTNASASFNVITVPSTPSITSFGSITYSNFTVYYSGGSGATSFTYTLNGVTTTPVGTSSGAATFSGLSASTTYSVVVTATNSSGSVSSGASSVTTAVAIPSAPSGVTASSITSTGFTISWSGSSTATAYTFTLNGSPVTPSSVSVGGQTATFTGLSPGQTYSVIVTGSNISGSASSTALSVTTGGAPALQVLTQTTLAVMVALGLVWDSTGDNMYVVNYNAPCKVWKVSYPGFSLSLYCDISTIGWTNAVGLCMDSNGNLYVSNNENETTCKITGPNQAEPFSSGSNDMVIAQDGFMYIASRSTVQRISPSGVSNVITPSFTDGSLTYWNSTAGLVVGQDGKIYVCDCNNHRVVRMNTDGSNAITFAGSSSGVQGHTDGTGTNARLSYPIHSCMDTNGNLYTIDVGQPLFYIRKITSAGVVTTYAGNGNKGTTDGPLLSASVGANYLAIGPDGNLWFTDAGNTVRLAQFSPPIQPQPKYVFNGSAATPPNQPINLTMVSNTSSGFTIGWDNGDPATGVTITLNGSPISPNLLYMGGKTATFTGLNPGTTYNVVITPTNGAGSGSSSSSVPITTAYAIPTQPTSLSSSSITTSGFTIGWLAGDVAVSYSYTLNGSSATPSSQSVGSKTATFTALTSGANYSVVVTAVNPTGTTSSNPFSVTVGALPTTPQNISGSAVSAVGFTISWTGGLNATSYTFSLDGTPTVPSSYSVANQTATFAGLNASTTYSVIVNAINSYGTASSAGGFNPTSISGANLWLDGADPLGSGTPPSAGATFATWYDKSGNNYNATSYSSPTYISGGGISLNGSSQYFLVSTYSGTNNNETGFVVVNFNNSNHQNLLMSSTTNARELVLFSNLINLFSANVGAVLTAPPPTINTTNLIEYSLNSTATNIYLNGNSTASGGGYAPVAETSLTIARNSVGASAFLNGKLYEIIIYNSVVSTTTRQLVEGYLAWKWGFQSSLPSNHPYKNSAPGTAGTNISTSNTPQAPIGITGSSITQTGFTLNWSGGAAATSYTYTFNGSPVTPISSSVSNKTATFTGLTAGTPYAIIITSVNSFGSTPSSSTNIPTVPSQPTSLTSSAVTSSGFTISWSGGTGATSYTYVNNSSSIVPSSDQGVSNKTATFTGLSEGVTYNIVVNATNSSGSTSSSSISVTPVPAAIRGPGVVNNNRVLISPPAGTGGGFEYDYSTARAGIQQFISGTWDIYSYDNMPPDLTKYAFVWDIYFDGIPASAYGSSVTAGIPNNIQTIYRNYLIAGGAIFIHGEHGYIAGVRTASIASFVSMMGGGNVTGTTVVGQDSVTFRSQYVYNGYNNAPYTIPANGTFGSLGGGTALFNNSMAAAIWTKGTMSVAPSGCLISYLDINSVETGYGRTDFIQNLGQILFNA